MSVSFDSYRIFYYVGKYKNITHAASALFLSQSTVSRCIQNLEFDLNCKLFERSQQGVVFTTEGEVLYTHVSQAVEHIFTAEDKVRQMQLLDGGSIRIGVSDFTFQQYVLPVLKPFHSSYPSVHLKVSTLNFDSQASMLDAISSNLVDFACVCSPVPAVPGLDAEYVTEFEDAIIASVQYSELRGKSFKLDELVNSYPFASLNSGADGVSYLDLILSARGSSITPAFQVNSINLFLPMVAQGLCLAVVPVPLLDSFDQDGQIFRVELSDSLPARKVCILTSQNSPHSAAREEMLRQLKRYIRAQTPEE